MKGDFTLLKRFSLATRDNFQSLHTTTESLVSLFLVVGLAAYLLLLKSFLRKNKEKVGSFEIAFFLTLVFNSVFILFFTRAREARLFAIPLFFVWPVFAQRFWPEFTNIFKRKLVGVKKAGYYLSLAICIVLLFLFCIKIYYGTGAKTNDNLFNEYFFALASLIASNGLYLFWTEKKKAT